MPDKVNRRADENDYDLYLKTQLEIPLGEYKHWKGNIYKVVGIALNTETLKPDVIYIQVTTSNTGLIKWSRPASEWYDIMPDGQQRYTKL